MSRSSLADLTIDVAKRGALKGSTRPIDFMAAAPAAPTLKPMWSPSVELMLHMAAWTAYTSSMERREEGRASSWTMRRPRSRRSRRTVAMSEASPSSMVGRRRAHSMASAAFASSASSAASWATRAARLEERVVMKVLCK